MRSRYLAWVLVPGLVAFGLMLTNHKVDHSYHMARVQPFILMSMAQVLMIAVLAVQHPGPGDDVPWWAFWRWVDPLVLVLGGMLAGSAIYYVMLWGGKGEYFQAPDTGYDIARWILWIDGWALASVGMELLYRGIRSRWYDWRRSSERYDLQDEGASE